VIYVVLSTVFLGIACIAAVIAIVSTPAHERGTRIRRWIVPLAVTGAALMVLTAVFDNIMIALGFMVYSDAHTTGLAIGLAPLEDFSYPLAGLVLLPALWVIFTPHRSDASRD